MGGGELALFQKQFLKPLGERTGQSFQFIPFSNEWRLLFIYRKGWRKEYEIRLTGKRSGENKRSLEERRFLRPILNTPSACLGTTIENRGTQVTFSALGDRAPLPFKKNGTAGEIFGQGS